MVVAFVTGASRGIGRAIALQLADDGMDIAVAFSLRSKTDAFHTGQNSICLIGDVSQEAAVQAMIQSVVAYLGELNVMVANAGIVVAKPMLEVSVEEWDKVHAVNIRGVMLCYREAAKQMILQGKGGKILGACSTAGFRGSSDAAAYSMSKWAVRGMSQAAASEFAPYDINVSYAPGPVDTNMWQEIDASIAERHGLKHGVAFAKSIEARSALKRAQTPEDIPNLVSFLASAKARNITGQSVLCDAGINFS
ncbi:acetoin reductase family protein [Pyrenochaeta sp. DS3sAY3a]|nr:acetoin reductase family protein [Pyrenochaeta sp. DS3sAY3a]